MNITSVDSLSVNKPVESKVPIWVVNTSWVTFGLAAIVVFGVIGISSIPIFGQVLMIAVFAAMFLANCYGTKHADDGLGIPNNPDRYQTYSPPASPRIAETATRALGLPQAAVSSFNPAEISIPSHPQSVPGAERVIPNFSEMHQRISREMEASILPTVPDSLVRVHRKKITLEQLKEKNAAHLARIRYLQAWLGRLEAV